MSTTELERNRAIKQVIEGIGVRSLQKVEVNNGAIAKVQLDEPDEAK